MELQEKKRQNIILISVGVVLILMIIFSLLVVRAYQLKKRANKEITQQKRIIEEKQKEMLDSIYYARKIQRSLLPREAFVEKILNKLNKS